MHTPGCEECPRCGAEFGCSVAQAGCACWCTELHVTSGRLVHLAHEYTGCLCPTCLTELSASETSQLG